GSIIWTSGDPMQHERLADLGPEPLGDDFNGEYLYAQSRKRKVAIKPFLMNAKVVVGVGNIYASEALFRACIKPSRLAGTVSLASYARLAEIVKVV
ncbi:DNA-formamidopyrimidine glycosylase, partial [candidate division KSB1 bacterium]|nr:DNA-formamidopyrimidine glycosylase [candidate division KSB1 bacterium]